MDAKENLERISDGKLYTNHDMAKIGCHDCTGCSHCCRGMGQSIILDPYDAFLLSFGLHKTFEQLLMTSVELHVVDRLIIPNLVMRTETDTCVFLDDDGRCRIHAFRPGLCRIFPLGRHYEKDTLRYFVLTDACPMHNKTKMKLEKWLDTPNLKEKQQFLITWHAFVKRIRRRLAECGDAEARAVNVAFLQFFYLKPYNIESDKDPFTVSDFYEEFYKRLKRPEFQ